MSKEGRDRGYTPQEWHKKLGNERDCIDIYRLPIKKEGKKPHKVLFDEQKYVIVNEVTCQGGYKLDLHIFNICHIPKNSYFNTKRTFKNHR